MGKIYFVNNDESGYTRKRIGKRFSYFLANGDKLTTPKSLARIKKLKIPPAYEKVWICKSPNGHIQAYGYDNKNRKQYIYHPQWRAKQEKHKFDHLTIFGKSLSKIRKTIHRNLKLKKLSKEKVLAAAIKMLDKTSIRIGSPQYDSYGLLTIRKRHVKIKGSTIILDFDGKSNQHWHLELYDKALSELLKRFEKYPGYKIFKYLDENSIQTLKVSDINDYLKRITHQDITAKEFRTWKGSVYYLHYLLKYKNKGSEVIQRICLEKVAKLLGNTPKVCKSSYIHPALFQPNIVSKIQRLKHNKTGNQQWLSLDERLLLKILPNSEST